MMTFIYPDLEEEASEFLRVSVEEGISLEVLRRAAAAALLVPFPRDEWMHLNNTWSWETTDIEAARRYATEIGRDVERIIRGFRQGFPMPAPIVLRKPNGELTLVAGNTRLSVARALNITPAVLMVDLTRVT